MITKNIHERSFQYPDLVYHDNKTIRYLLPTLGMRVDKLHAVVNNVNLSSIDILRLLGLRGVYCSWVQCPDKLKNEVYMLFCPKKDALYTSFPVFYKYVSAVPNFIKLYHVNNNLMVIAMTIDAKWHSAKETIATSKYSKLGKNYANAFFNNNGKLSKEFHIICRTEEYRRKLEIELNLPEDHLINVELDEFFYLEKEVLDLQKLNIKFIEI